MMTTEKLHPGDSATDSDYGAVYGVPSHTTDDEGTLTISDNLDTITWTGVSLKKDHTLTTHVNNVKITDRAGNYAWTTRVSGNDGDTRIGSLQTMPPPMQMKWMKLTLHTLYVEETEKDGIVFEIDGGSEATYKAASKQPITFTFTAETTPIRNGEVSFAIPNNWSPPKPA